MGLAPPERLQELGQQDLAGMYRRHDRAGHHRFLLVVVNDLDISCGRPAISRCELCF
jgi:hypothetical protein